MDARETGCEDVDINSYSEITERSPPPHLPPAVNVSP